MRVLLLLLVACCGLHAGDKRALIVGIDTYFPPGTKLPKIPAGGLNGLSRFDMPNWPNLKGAVADARLMRDLLVSPKFGFPVQNVHMLLENEASHDAILAAIKKYLIDDTVEGDTVVLYYAGHGSLRLNSKSEKNSKHLDNTIVPSDANTGEFDVRDREIARLFNAALDKGIHLTAIFDSCHSGSIARGIQVGTPGQARFLEGFDPRDINEGPDMRDGKPVTAPEDRKDNAALVFSATEPDQLAQERDFDGEHHGAFTVALVEALRFLPAEAAANDVYKRVKVVMEGMGGTANQQPILDGTPERKREPLLGAGARNSATRVAVAAIDESGGIILDSGIAGDIGPGSEFVRVSEPGAAGPVHIRVTKLDSLARSHAELISPAAEKVEIGDLFEVVKWVPAGGNPLPLWSPTATFPTNGLSHLCVELAALSKSDAIEWVDDPAAKSPEFLVSWDGSRWAMLQAGHAGATDLGENFSAKAVLAKLPKKKSSLLVNLPPTQELDKALRAEQPGTFQFVNAAAQAKYLLIGTYAHQTIAYAWVSKELMENGTTLAAAEPSETACSSASPYPARTDWKTLAEPDSAVKTGRELNELATRLARIHEWLELPTPASDTNSYPYHLALKKDDGTVVDQQATGGQHVNMFLTSDAPVAAGTASRWVYVLDLDCQGNGTLLYPAAGVNNRLPAHGSLASEIPLERSGFRFGKPFGMDTLIMLTTAEQLPDASVLSFQGVATGSARGVGPTSALQRLLSNASAGTRGAAADQSSTPTDWGIQYLAIHTHEH